MIPKIPLGIEDVLVIVGLGMAGLGLGWLFGRDAILIYVGSVLVILGLVRAAR